MAGAEGAGEVAVAGGVPRERRGGGGNRRYGGWVCRGGGAAAWGGSPAAGGWESQGRAVPSGSAIGCCGRGGAACGRARSGDTAAAGAKSA